MQISDMADAIQPSLTRRLFNKAKEYDHVIDLTLGDPDFVPPQPIRDAACVAIQAGKTHYSANAGLLELREAICGQVNRETGLGYRSDEVIVTAGAMEGLYLALLTMLNKGDEVILCEPYYVNYHQMVQMCGGTPVVVPTDVLHKTKMDRNLLERAVTGRTKAIIINSPRNPTGDILSRQDLELIADVATSHDLAVISDEVYKTLLYTDETYLSIVRLPGMKERTIVMDSFSKKYSMTGYRVGYAAAPVAFVAAMTKLQENVVACAPLPSQYAALEALRYGDNQEMVRTFRRRRDVLLDALGRIPGVRCIPPQGSFYAFVDISETGMSSEAFCFTFLERMQVAVVPGNAYGRGGEGYVRIAFTVDEGTLREAAKRMSDFIEEVMHDKQE